MPTLIKEKPIPMSFEMVKAILKGKKTQTRRVIKKPEQYGNIREIASSIFCDVCCPYGQVGDRLWVRETWTPDIYTGQPLWYKADGVPSVLKNMRWKYYMPRWASRITLEITGIKVEKLQEITEEDAEAEGLDRATYDNPNSYADFPCTNQFIALWNSIYARQGYSWHTNPWVWVIEFEKLVE